MNLFNELKNDLGGFTGNNGEVEIEIMVETGEKTTITIWKEERRCTRPKASRLWRWVSRGYQNN